MICGIARDSDVVVVVVLVLLATSERESEGSSTFWLFGEPRSARELQHVDIWVIKSIFRLLHEISAATKLSLAQMRPEVRACTARLLALAGWLACFEH